MTATLTVQLPEQMSVASTQAVMRTADVVQDLINQFTPEELNVVSAHIERALASPGEGKASPKSGLIDALTNGRRYSPDERLALKLSALLRSFRYRDQLLSESLTVAQVAEVLGTSRQTPHDRVKSGTLLAVSDRGALRFPIWQFDAQAHDRVIAGLPTVLRALHVAPLAKVSWFVLPNPSLDGRTPFEALRAGEIERVVRVAEGVGPS
jgi:hypothetical protein